MSKKEAQARVRINKLLEQAGWRFFPDGSGPDNIICEHRVSKKVIQPTADLGADFEKAPDGFMDYLLLNPERKPVAVVEAKRESINPLEAKEQARAYAQSQAVNHIFLSNGLVHYYWDLRNGNPTRISHFLSLDQLGDPSYRTQLMGRGANINNLSQDLLRELVVPVPPLAEQRRLVSELEAERALVEANRELAARFEQKLQSRLAEIWGEAPNNPSGPSSKPSVMERTPAHSN